MKDRFRALLSNAIKCKLRHYVKTLQGVANSKRQLLENLSNLGQAVQVDPGLEAVDPAALGFSASY